MLKIQDELEIVRLLVKPLFGGHYQQQLSRDDRGELTHRQQQKRLLLCSIIISQ